MKLNLFSRILIIQTILIISYFNCKTQTIECDQCSTIVWSGVFTYQSSVCNASVSYQTRLCNDGSYQIKITHIGSLQTNTDMINLQACLIYELLKNNPMLFPPSSPQDGTKVWKIYKKACWQFQDSFKQIQIPCDLEDCCITTVKVKREGDCNIFDIVDEVGTVEPQCPNFGISNSGCMNTCVPLKVP